MGKIEKDLQHLFQYVVKGLKAVTKEAEKLQKKVDKLGEVKAPRKARAKAKAKVKPVKKVATRKPAPKKRRVAKKAARSAKASAADVMLRIIETRKRPVNIATLREKTGFGSQKVRDNLHKLKTRGKIKNVGKGIYTKA
jgi:hypothetical protein